jgi:hypothetical protein
MNKWQTVIGRHLKRAVLVKEARKTNLVTEKHWVLLDQY